MLFAECVLFDVCGMGDLLESLDIKWIFVFKTSSGLQDTEEE